MKKIVAFFQTILILIMSIPNFNFQTFSFKCDTDFTVDAIEKMDDSSLLINNDFCSFEIKNGKVENGLVEFEDSVTFTFKGKTGLFNYFGIKYTSSAYLKGTVTYTTICGEHSEDFFLESGDDVVFHSFIDNFLEGKKAHTVLSLRFEGLDNNSVTLMLGGFSTFMHEVPQRIVYISNGKLTAGADLQWGGALSYLEDLDSSVQVVKKDGKIHVDSNAAERYGTESVNNKVNLINCHDAGRLVQQSYYGTDGANDSYEPGTFMDSAWPYNPVQGGNQFNGNSKIIDLVFDEASIYVKCRPMDWAKDNCEITPSYMEASYALDGNSLLINCRFVDFSGYNERPASQELPAFYTIAPFDTYVYYSGNSPWTGDTTLTKRDDLYFWPDMGYPHFNTTENWSAFIGEFDDSFGVGLWVPGRTSTLAGICEPGKTTSTDPATDIPTSYIAVVDTLTFRSFTPFEYNYWISTGNIDEIRSEFASADAELS